MDQEIKQKWVKALRSGKYKQGETYLHRTDNRFCCLGVLCDLAAKEGVVSAIKSDEDDVAYAYDAWSQILPPSVMAWADLADANPVAGAHALANLNDTGTTFAQIADIIEEHL